MTNHPTPPRTRDAIEQDAREMIDHINYLLDESSIHGRDRKVFMRELAKGAKAQSEIPLITI